MRSVSKTNASNVQYIDGYTPIINFSFFNSSFLRDPNFDSPTISAMGNRHGHQLFNPRYPGPLMITKAKTSDF